MSRWRVLCIAGYVALSAGDIARGAACPAAGFAARSVVPIGASPSALLAGDLNGDGRLDLVAVDGSGVRVALNTGEGRFGPFVPRAEGGTKAVLADFYGDGKLDLVVVRASSLALLVGDGAGEFREAGPLGPAGIISTLVTGDFDGNGRTDLAFLFRDAPEAPSTIAVLVSSGHGTFAEWPRTSVEYARSLVASDFDGDGKSDLLVDQCGAAVLLRSHGSGAFTSSVAIPGSGANCLYVSARVGVADVNGDGHPDLVQTTSYKFMRFGIRAYFGDGLGGFAAGVGQYLDINPGGSLPAPVLGDFDGDGRADVAAAYEGGVAVLRGIPAGLHAPEIFPVSGTADFLVAGDFDGDGRPDLLTYDGILLANTCRGGTFERALAVPILVAAPGAGDADWSSDLTITNAGTTPAALELTYTATVGGGTGTVATTLPPGAQLSDPDAFHLLAGLGLETSGAGPRVGTLRARFRGLSSPHAAAIRVRVSSAGAGVGFGGLEPDPAASQVVDWLKQDSEDRSNLAVMNAGSADEGEIRVRVTLVATDATSPGSIALPEISLAPGGFRQLDRVLETSGLNAASAFARVERTGGTAPFVAWGVLNDQVTSDGSVCFARPATVARFYALIPTVVETPAYTTEVVVTNAGPSEAAVDLYYSAAASRNDGRGQLTAMLGENATWHIPSFVEVLRGLGTPGIGPAGDANVGSLGVQLSPRESFGAGARILTRAPGGGRYGVFLPATDWGGGFGPNTTAWIPDLRQDETYRTNLVLLNGTFRVELFDPSGRLVTTREDVPSGQINAVLKVWAPGVTRAWARVTRTSQEPYRPFAAWAVVNHGAAPGLGTGDGAIVWMEPDP